MTSLPTPAWLEADWPAPPGVRALTTLRHGLGASLAPFDRLNLGLYSGDDQAAVVENRRQLEVALALPSAPRWLRQVHGVDVVRFGSARDPPPAPAARPLSLAHPLGAAAGEVSNPSPLLPPLPLAGEGWGEGALVNAEPEADAAVTSSPGTVLAILTADCLPAVFAARDGSEVAAAHAGWRGLATGMLEATVAAMHAPASDVVAWLGPCAGPQMYEIGEEVFDTFVSRDARAASAFVATRPGHWKVDLYTLARQRLSDAGIASADIHGGGLCTISEPARFFSHRRDQRTGRMATLVWRQ